ncbi:MAG: hypothetical protein ACRDKZ_11580 [Actinomycetota bacterium]
MKGIEHDLKRVLKAAGSIDPPDPMRAAARFQVRRRRRSMAGGTLAVVLLVGAVPFTTSLVGRLNTDGVASAGGPAVSAFVQTPHSPYDVVAAGDSVWASTHQSDSLYRIDPATNEIGQTVTLPTRAMTTFAHLATTGQDVLVAGPDDALYRVDAGSGEVEGRTPLAGSPFEIAASGDAVFILLSDEQQAFIVRLDAHSFEETARVEVAGVKEMQFASGRLWISVADIPERSRSGSGMDAVFDLSMSVRALDPQTLRTLVEAPLEGDTYRPGDTLLGHLVEGAGSLWSVRAEAAVVDRLDPLDGHVLGQIPVTSLDMPSSVAFADGFLWAADLNKGGVIRIDPATSAETGPVIQTGQALSDNATSGFGSAWFTSEEGVVRMDMTSPDDEVYTPPSPSPTVDPVRDVDSPPSEVADARAITFGFHALHDTVGYRYDYIGFERAGETWRLIYLDGPPPSEVEGIIESRRMMIDDLELAIRRATRAAQDVAAELARTSDDADRQRLQERLTRHENGIDSWRGSIDDAMREIDEWAETLRATLQEAGPNRIVLTVVERDGQLVIDRVEGPVAEAGRAELAAFTRPVDEIEVGGTLYFNVQIKDGGEFPFVEGRMFWTGPIPSDYKEVCVLEFVDASGTIAYRHFPDRAAEHPDRAPRTEDMRDGGATGSEVDPAELPAPIEELTPRFSCEPAP